MKKKSFIISQLYTMYLHIFSENKLQNEFNTFRYKI